jgi:hypothetical protein
MDKNTHGPLTYHACVEETLGRKIPVSLTIEHYHSGKPVTSCIADIGGTRLKGRTFKDYDDMDAEVQKWIELIKARSTDELAQRIDVLKPITAAIGVDHLFSLIRSGDVEGLDYDEAFYLLRGIEDRP